MYEEALQREEDSAEASEELRIGQDLIRATVPFTEASASVSWRHVGSTFAMLMGALVGAGAISWWPLRLLFSVLAAMLMVRAFITYHDYMHRAILVRSRFAWILFRIYAALALTPPRSWKKSHNYHHGHVGQISSASIGAFPIMTTQMWREASRSHAGQLPDNPTSAHRANGLCHNLLPQRHFVAFFAGPRPTLGLPAGACRPCRLNRGVVDTGRLRYCVLRRAVADDYRFSTRELSLFCAAQF